MWPSRLPWGVSHPGMPGTPTTPLTQSSLPVWGPRWPAWSLTPLLFLDVVGREVLHRPWGAASERTVAHGGHSVTGAAAVEGSPERGLEGQDLLPLVPAAPAPSGLHQVGARPPPRGPESLFTPRSCGRELLRGALVPLPVKWE